MRRGQTKRRSRDVARSAFALRRIQNAPHGIALTTLGRARTDF